MGLPAKLLLLAAFLPLMVSAASNSTDDNINEETSVSRNPRFFWKFILISPEECTTTTGTEGICYSKKDCKALDGEALGTCAKGLGVCCYVTYTCDGSSSAEISRFVNPSSPDTDTSFDDYDNMCMFTVNLRNNICQLRLDMDEFTIAPPDTEVDGDCIDTFTVLRSTNPNIPTICGENAEQHMYIDVDPEGPNPKLLFAGLTDDFAREWDIMITQIECDSEDEVPKRCLQYFTGVTGTVESFNFNDGEGQQLNNQNYEVCVDQQDNYCEIDWEQGTAFEMTPGAFDDTVVCSDYVLINGDEDIVTRYCGNAFDGTTSTSLDFGMQVFTDDTELSTATPLTLEEGTGFQLTYTQSAC